MKWLSARGRAACIGVSALMLSLPTAAAEPTGLGDALSLQRAVANALAKNPELQTSTYALRAADARTTQRALVPTLNCPFNSRTSRAPGATVTLMPHR